MLSFVFFGDPVGDARPRFNRKTGIATQPDKPSRWKSDAMATIANELPEEHTPMVGALKVNISAFLKRPERLKRRMDAPGPTWASNADKGSKPDIDNIAKLVLDTLVVSGVIKDDTFVSSLFVHKFYVSKDGSTRPRVTVDVERCSACPACGALYNHCGTSCPDRIRAERQVVLSARAELTAERSGK